MAEEAAAEGEAGAKKARTPKALTVAGAKKRLAKFLEKNPASSIVEADLGDGIKAPRLDLPWGDPTLCIVLPFVSLKDLNQLILPERLSAIWHRDTGDVEVIWTVYPLSPDVAKIYGRKFTFSFNRQSYECEFGPSSERLLKLASGVVPVASASSTNHRNMESFFSFAHREKVKKTGLDTPKSFWIKNVKLSDVGLIELIRHLNFYLSYFDSKSPVVLIHDVDRSSMNEKIRYPLGKFPEVISSRQLDDSLLIFWTTARSGNPMLRFILYYRIIEFAAFHYLDAGIKAKLKQIVANPAVCLDIDDTLEAILLAIDPKKGEDVPRFNALLTAAVRPKLIWQEVSNNKDFFSKPLKFDGGFTIDRLIDKDEKAKSFEAGGLVKLADSLRKIRNVLSHGRDQNTSTAITPTARNFKNLQPWVNLAAVAAGEVVLYEAVS